MSNYPASNDNPHELLVKNILNFFRKEKLLYLRVLCTLITITGNKRHDISFIGKSKKPINNKISIAF